MDVRRSADAIQQAGAATLDLAQREEAIIVEPGGLLGLEGLLLRNNAPTGAWLAKRPDQPRGIGFNPAIICQPEGLVSALAFCSTARGGSPCRDSVLLEASLRLLSQHVG